MAPVGLAADHRPALRARLALAAAAQEDRLSRRGQPGQAARDRATQQAALGTRRTVPALAVAVGVRLQETAAAKPVMAALAVFTAVAVAVLAVCADRGRRLRVRGKPALSSSHTRQLQLLHFSDLDIGKRSHGR